MYDVFTDIYDASVCDNKADWSSVYLISHVSSSSPFHDFAAFFLYWSNSWKQTKREKKNMKVSLC